MRSKIWKGRREMATVVLIDSDPVSAGFTERLLTSEYTVIKFSSVEDYIAAGSPFDADTVIVTEHLLQGMTGVDLALRSPEKRKRIIILASIPDAAKKEAERKGIKVAVLFKFDLVKLPQLVKKALKKPL